MNNKDFSKNLVRVFFDHISYKYINNNIYELVIILETYLKLIKDKKFIYKNLFL